MSPEEKEENEWASIRAKAQAIRYERARVRINKMKEHALLYDVEVREITPTHFRLYKPGYKNQDFYPVTGKVNMVGTKRYYKIIIPGWMKSVYGTK